MAIVSDPVSGLRGLRGLLRSLAARPRRDSIAGSLSAGFNARLERLQADFQRRVAELEHERSKSAAIIESVEDGLIVLDQNGVIVHINEVAHAILGIEPSAAADSSLERLGKANVHVARLVELRGRGHASGAPVEFKLFVRGRDHSYISRELPWTDLHHRTLGTIIVLQDVTLIRDQERARADLIATLSHELKTPLTSLAIGADLLAEAMHDDIVPRRREILATILDDVGRLKGIANDLLDVSRSTAARIGVERRAILLDRVVCEVCRPLMLQAQEKRVHLEVLTGGEPIPIWGDPIKLPWVITNLVGNALRYTPAGGTIGVDLGRDGGLARAIVRDTGEGIAADLLPRIFEPYAQFPDNPARAGSAGLGLYITREIVQAHNGRIFVTSCAGHGSTFTVEIPLREDALADDPDRR